MQVRCGARTYEWVAPWGDLPDPEECRTAWPHSAIVYSRRNRLIAFHPARSAVVVLRPDGTLESSIPTVTSEAHGMTIVSEGPEEYLWLANASVKRRPDRNYLPKGGSEESEVIQIDLRGRVRQRLARPPHPIYEKGHYRPTGIAVDEVSQGGNGDIWVADGYGESLVHRFRSDGRYIGSLTGEEGAGRFLSPHAVFIDRRRTEPELYVADRGNARLQVYSQNGEFLRVAGAGDLSRPTAMVTEADLLLVAEFKPPRLAFFDSQDRWIGYLGENPDPVLQEQFPFTRGKDGRPVVPAGMGPGKFGIPHGMAIDRDGSLYFSEVVFGSRFTKLRRVG